MKVKILVVGFIGSCLRIASLRANIFVFFNLLFFGGMFFVVLSAGLWYPLPLYSGWSPGVPEVFLVNWLWMVVGIFLFNLVLSSFVVVTLPGMFFFPLSAGFLVYRAVLWGLLVRAMPNWLLFVVLPTLVLEGEAYVFAAAAGTVVGVSWVKPGWIGPEEAGLRSEAFGKALKDCLRLYVFVVVLLFVAAVVETVAILCVA